MMSEVSVASQCSGTVSSTHSRRPSCDRRGSPRLAGTAQHREEHRVGAVPVRPQLHGRAGAEAGHAVRAAAAGRRRTPPDAAIGGPSRSPSPASRRCAASRSRTPTTPPGRTARIAAASSSRCSRVNGGRSLGYAASAPPGGGAASRARNTARRRAPGRTPPAGSSASRPTSRPSAQMTVTGSPRRRLVDQVGPVRRDLDRGHVRAALAPRARRAAPPCRPGPAHRSSQRSSRPVERRVGERHRDQLRALVLHVRRRRATIAGRSPGEPPPR